MSESKDRSSIPDPKDWTKLDPNQRFDLLRLQRLLQLDTSSGPTWKEKIPRIGRYPGYNQFQDTEVTQSLPPEVLVILRRKALNNLSLGLVGTNAEAEMKKLVRYYSQSQEETTEK